VREHYLEPEGDEITVQYNGPYEDRDAEVYTIPLAMLLIAGDAAFDSAILAWWTTEQNVRKRERQAAKEEETAARERKERREYERLAKKFGESP